MSENTGKQPQPKAKRSRAGLWFLLAMLVIYSLVAIANLDYARQGMHSFVDMIKTLLPALLLVFVLLIVFNLIQGIQQKLAGITGVKSGVKGWWIAIIGGILSHGPIYAWYPLLGELKLQGMRPALLAAFLYARSIKLPYLPIMAHYFGLSYTLVFSFYIVVFSVVNGWFTEWLLAKANNKIPAGGLSK